MKLYHPFPQEVRNLFLYHQYCFKCGSNGTQTGGLELHHICGRRKTGIAMDSALNASVLCKKCHDSILHTKEVQLILFKTTARILHKDFYKLINNDIIFLQEHCQEEFGLTIHQIANVLEEIIHDKMDSRRISELVEAKRNINF